MLERRGDKRLALFEAAGIYAYANRHSFGFSGAGHGLNLVAAADIAGIQTKRIRTGLKRGKRKTVVEMDVGDNRDRALADGTFDGDRIRLDEELFKQISFPPEPLCPISLTG